MNTTFRCFSALAALCGAAASVVAADVGLSDWVLRPEARGDRFEVEPIALLSLVDEAVASSGSVRVALPVGRGAVEEVELVPSRVLPDDLAARYPMIRTYRALRDGRVVGSLTVSETSVYGRVSTEAGDVSLSTVAADPSVLRVRRLGAAEDEGRCGCAECARPASAAEGFGIVQGRLEPPIDRSSTTYGGIPAEMHEFRRAVLVEDQLATALGSEAAGCAFVAAMLNQINMSTEPLGFRYTMVPYQNLLIFLDPATDPIGPDSSTWSCDGAAHITDVYGESSAEFAVTIGLRPSLPPLGRAGIGSCASFTRGACWMPTPGLNRPRLLGYVRGQTADASIFAGTTTIHEFGHQHSWLHVGGTGYEGDYMPRLSREYGLTVMSQGVERLSRTGIRFHPYSVENHLSDVGGPCNSPDQTITAPTNRTPSITVPAVSAQQSLLPIGTPFEFGATITDSDGDRVAAGMITANATRWWIPPVGEPTFPYIPPAEGATSWTFPSEWALYAGRDYLDGGGHVSAYSAGLQAFFLQAWDFNHEGGGIVQSDRIDFEVIDTAGPFAVTAPDAYSVLTQGTTTVIWDPANTGATGTGNIGASTVDITLSTDGGVTFPHMLASATPNDGSHAVTLPSVRTNRARIKVKGTDRLFFDVNPGPVSIDPLAATLAHRSSADVSSSLGVPSMRVTLVDPSSEISGGGVALYWRHKRWDDPWRSVAMSPIGSGVYEAQLPNAVACEAVIEYYFIADNGSGGEVVLPTSAPWSPYVWSMETPDAVYEFDGTETWTVTPAASAPGKWELVSPSAGASHVPASDWDGSGHCWVTGSAPGDDVDGIEVFLELPVQPEDVRVVEIAYWVSGNDAAPLTAGDGISFQGYAPSFPPPLDWGTLGGTSGAATSYAASSPNWRVARLDFSDLDSGANYDLRTFRIRALDSGADSTVEAAIDWIKLYFDPSGCTPADCPIDYAPPIGALDLHDADRFVELFSASDPAADLAPPSGTFDVSDIAAFNAYFQTGCRPE